MPKTIHPDGRAVYLALKNVFKGPNADINQLKPIQKLIQKNREKPDIANLIKEHGLATVSNSVQGLLVEKIFSSTLKAKCRFPDVFDVSPAETAEREASEAEAARHEANAIKEVVHTHEERGRDATKPREEIERESSMYTIVLALFKRLCKNYY